MNRKIIAVVILAMLSGCQSTKDVESMLSERESMCAEKCTEYFRICDQEHSLTPIAHHNGCSDTYRYCVQTCPGKDAKSTIPASSGASGTPSAEDRLKQLESLHKQGLITDSEYASKRQEILKSM